VTKTRIHEFARELKMDNKDLLKILEKMGVEVKSVHSTLDDLDIERIKSHLNLSRKEGLVEQRVKPTVIRRRVKKEEALPAPEPAVPETAQPHAGKPAEKKAPAAEGPRREEAPPTVKPSERRAVAAGEEAPPKHPEELPPSLKATPAPPLPGEEEQKEARVEGIPPTAEPKPMSPTSKP